MAASLSLCRLARDQLLVCASKQASQQSILRVNHTCARCMPFSSQLGSTCGSSSRQRGCSSLVFFDRLLTTLVCASAPPFSLLSASRPAADSWSVQDPLCWAADSADRTGAWGGVVAGWLLDTPTDV